MIVLINNDLIYNDLSIITKALQNCFEELLMHTAQFISIALGFQIAIIRIEVHFLAISKIIFPRTSFFVVKRTATGLFGSLTNGITLLHLLRTAELVMLHSDGFRIGKSQWLWFFLINLPMQSGTMSDKTSFCPIGWFIISYFIFVLFKMSREVVFLQIFVAEYIVEAGLGNLLIAFGHFC